MHWTVVLFAGLALIAAHLLRLPKRGGLIGSSVSFAVGLVGTAMVIKLIAGAIGLGRTTEFDGFVNRGIEIAKQDDAPLIVFTGASYSRNAIDDERLTLALRERGYPHRVISLSLEAASIFERDAHLKDFISRSPRAPEIVFVEVAEPFDTRPTFFFGNSKFSTRAIEQFTLPVSAKTAKGLLGGGCHGAADCVKEAGFLGIHAGLNFFNVGLLSQGEDTASVTPAPSYSALFEPRQEMDTTALQAELDARPDVTPHEGLVWIKTARAEQRRRLKEDDGVRAVAYYFPPVTKASYRAYVSGVCAGELAAYTCINGDDPALLGALKPELWADPEHLLDDGAAIYLNWLADELAASGVLDGTLAPRGSLDTKAAR